MFGHVLILAPKGEIYSGGGIGGWSVVPASPASFSLVRSKNINIPSEIGFSFDHRPRGDNLGQDLVKVSSILSN